MGSWNKTCGLSNLPIMAGEPVYVFVLEKNDPKYTTEQCYTTWLYKPAMIPFYAEYNDYGAGENCSGIGLNILMNNIRDVLIEMPQGENKCHDIPVVRSGFAVENFFESVLESRLFMKNAYGNAVNIDFVMFRKDIVDYVLNNYQIETYVGNQNNYVEIKFQNLANDIPNLIKLISENIDKTVPYFVLNNILHKHKPLIMKFMRFDNYENSRIFRGIDQLLDNNCENPQRLEEILTDVLKFMWINMYMTHVRKTWMPAGHEGSQSDERNAYRTLIAATSAVLDRKDHEDHEDHEDDEMNGE